MNNKEDNHKNVCNTAITARALQKLTRFTSQIPVKPVQKLFKPVKIRFSIIKSTFDTLQ